jgi:hypothetical protein
LNQCLDRYENPDENIDHQSSASESPRFNFLGDGEPLASPQTPYQSPHSEAALTRKMDETTMSDGGPSAQNTQDPTGAQVLIVDDNFINRSVSNPPSQRMF